MRGVNTELEDIENMEIKEEDVWVCSFQRSGEKYTCSIHVLLESCSIVLWSNLQRLLIDYQSQWQDW